MASKARVEGRQRHKEEISTYIHLYILYIKLDTNSADIIYHIYIHISIYFYIYIK